MHICTYLDHDLVRTTLISCIAIGDNDGGSDDGGDTMIMMVMHDNGDQEHKGWFYYSEQTSIGSCELMYNFIVFLSSGEKPFQCDECGRRFARSTDLKVHLPVHSDDKPYKCGECEKMFTRFSTLKEHIRTHTGKIFLPFPFLLFIL